MLSNTILYGLPDSQSVINSKLMLLFFLIFILFFLISHFLLKNEKEDDLFIPLIGIFLLSLFAGLIPFAISDSIFPDQYKIKNSIINPATVVTFIFFMVSLLPFYSDKRKTENRIFRLYVLSLFLASIFTYKYTTLEYSENIIIKEYKMINSKEPEKAIDEIAKNRYKIVSINNKKYKISYSFDGFYSGERVKIGKFKDDNYFCHSEDFQECYAYVELK